MITGLIVGIVLGIFFSAKYPLPSQVIREKTLAGIALVKSMFTTTPPSPPAK